MGTLVYFDEVVRHSGTHGNQGCAVEVLDNHSIPEFRIGPEGAAYSGSIAEFHDWNQFTRFVDAVNAVHERLSGIHG